MEHTNPPSRPRYPAPTTDQPEDGEIEAMIIDFEDVTATDGCIVEPDGVCPHGHPSWLIQLGLI